MHRPVGDCIPDDLVFDIDGSLVRIRSKSARRAVANVNFVIDNRRMGSTSFWPARTPYAQRTTPCP